jgi:hypothetical protein
VRQASWPHAVQADHPAASVVTNAVYPPHDVHVRIDTIGAAAAFGSTSRNRGRSMSGVSSTRAALDMMVSFRYVVSVPAPARSEESTDDATLAERERAIVMRGFAAGHAAGIASSSSSGDADASNARSSFGTPTARFTTPPMATPTPSAPTMSSGACAPR